MHYPFHLLATDHNGVAAFVNQKTIYFINNEKVTSIEAHKSVIKVVQFSNDGKFLVTAAEDKTLKIWKINKTEGKIELQLLGELNVPKQVSSVAFSENSTNLFAADRFGDVIEIEVPSTFVQLRPKVVLGHVSHVTCLCVAKRLISGDRDERIRVSSICLPADIVSFCMGHEQFITSVKGINEKVISAAGDGTVRYWNGENGEEIDFVKLGKEQKEEERLEEEEQERKANPNAFHELIHTRSKPITFIADMTKDGRAFVFVESEPKLYLLSFGEKIKIEKTYDLPANPLSVISCGDDDFIASLENGEFFCSENAKKHFDVSLLPKLPDEENSQIEKFVKSAKLVHLRKRFIEGRKHDDSEEEEAPEETPVKDEDQRDSKKLKME